MVLTGTQATAPSILRSDEMHNPDTSLIARAEALNAFTRMQSAAATAYRTAPGTSAVEKSSSLHAPAPARPAGSSCLFCFGSSSRYNAAANVATVPQQRPRREYYPENLSVQPARHPWSKPMEWLILACVDFLEEHALDERNLFAVSAVDDLVRNLAVPLAAPLPRGTDPHVASGAIKMQMRYADEPLVPKECLASYIQSQSPPEGSGGGGGNAAAPPTCFADTPIAKTIDTIKYSISSRRAYIFARFMRLLGRVSANVSNSGMNAHCLAKCVAPSMLHWDPNSGYALLMLGKITGYVMNMIEDARKFDEVLCQTINSLGVN